MRFFRALVPGLYLGLTRLIFATCRWHWVGAEHLERLRLQKRAFIYCGWHENISVAVWLFRRQQAAMMASDSEDGDLIARAIVKSGNIPVRGSTSKGGSRAMRETVRLLRAGHLSAISPDGPRGPRRRFQAGTAWIAALAGVPLLPMHHSATREWAFAKSWDRHRIPKPFSTVIVAVGEPIELDAGCLRGDEAGVIAEIEARLGAVVETAERARDRWTRRQ
jgi:lysophospholipid acyltransferase (LPLAT)-like uncharacterized protein